MRRTDELEAARMRAYHIWERKDIGTANMTALAAAVGEIGLAQPSIGDREPSPNRRPNGKRKRSPLDLVLQDQKSGDWRSAAGAIVRR
jgi:hypothetical protein